MTVREALNSALDEEMARDERVYGQTGLCLFLGLV